MSNDLVDLKVTYASLDQAANDIQAAAKVVAQNLSDMWKAVEAVSHTWEGEAKLMFNAADQQFHARGKHIQETLDKIASTIRAGGADYQATDKKASQLFDISY
ncbi:WXG100 family type VII secretion target [Streptomyces sp. URMC 123]|uniref:WXG100 family type VII secretion target n=1 Tax=Streptomyces sp. URMC 123 TaxID=3423403 RepID=UPI003F1CFD4E